LQPWLDPAGTNPDTLNGISYSTIIGSNVVGCWEPEPFTASLPSLPSYYWSVSDPLTVVSGYGTNTLYVSANVQSPTTATITLNGIVTKQVRVGLPVITGINGPTTVKFNTPNTYTTIPNFTYSVGECMWYLSSYPLISSPGGTAELTFTQTGTRVLTAAPWGCYMSDPSPGLTISIYLGYDVIAGADRQITITPQSVADTASDIVVPQFDSTDMIEYTLTDEATGAEASKGQLPASGGTLYFTKVPAGSYIFRIIPSDGVYEEQRIKFDEK
jgi:hypothetical protein